MKKSPASLADVCLVLEGTYPYVSGGVSTWVHQIVTALSDVTFSLHFIGSEKPKKAEPKYTLPPNVVALHETYLFDPAEKAPKPRSVRVDEIQPILDAVRALVDIAPEARSLDPLCRAITAFAKRRHFVDLWHHPATFDLVSDLYETHFPQESFLDFFWTVRFLVEPAWRLIADLDRLPAARLYHSPCTGYAGLAGAVAAERAGAPFLLSEHGIYVKERIAEIQRARWIHETAERRPALMPQPAALRQLWIAFFQTLGRHAYRSASRITSLFQKNAGLQVEYGADPEKIEIVPNGVDCADYDAIRTARTDALKDDPQRMVIGFLGRIVGIKDVKTLIQAAAIVHRSAPKASFRLTGPTDEEPGYFEECRQLVARLGLESAVKFTGPMKLGEFLPQVDIVTLASLSEGLPFVVLEAFAAGLPMVSTDVGSCRELIEGRADESPAFGPAGYVVPVGDAERLADAILRLIDDPARAAEFGANGRRRVAAHYVHAHVIDRFRQLYRTLAGSAAATDNGGWKPLVTKSGSAPTHA